MADRVGQQLGNYRLIRLVGEGGFAEVYLGEHLYLNTPAAIKVLQTRLAKDDLEGFLSEARTIAALKHPHIVRVLDFGVEGGTPFLVMDYALGGTLRERIPRGTQLSLVAILPIVRQVADALQYAHDRRLIHRDVKPENMLLDERGQIMLSDFGIATIAQSSRYQQTEGVAGTAAYMAPEQLQGKPRPASDQYSLGIVIYEWLTGTRPFQGSFAEIASQHLFVPPPPLSEKLPIISPVVEQTVLRALAKDPRERFASVQEFAAALAQAGHMNQPTLIRPAPELTPTLPAVAPPVTTPPRRSAWGEPPPAEQPQPSRQFAPMRTMPPRPADASTFRRPSSPPSQPLPPTMPAAAPPVFPATPTRTQEQSRGPILPPPPFSGSLREPAAPPAPLPRAKPRWNKGLLVGGVALALVLVIVVLVRLNTAGNGASGLSGASSRQATFAATRIPRPALGTIKEFVLPDTNSSPQDITAGPDGSLWFTIEGSNQIGRVTPGGSLTEFPLPKAGSVPEGITAGPDGNLWFTEFLGNRIGRITPEGKITEFAVPTPDSGIEGITAGPDGNVWFTEFAGKIGRITPAGKITEFVVSTANSNPVGITTGPDGNLWFTDDQRKVGRITPGGKITEFATSNAGLGGITVGPDGNLWFTESGIFAQKGSSIGRVTPGGSVTELYLPIPGSFPEFITAGPDGNLWFTQRNSNQIGRITPSGSVQQFNLPSNCDDGINGCYPEGITRGPDGNLWFTEFNGHKIGWISPGP